MEVCEDAGSREQIKIVNEDVEVYFSRNNSFKSEVGFPLSFCNIRNKNSIFHCPNGELLFSSRNKRETLLITLNIHLNSF